MMAYNCSPSFNWEAKLDKATIARFQREIGAMGYKFQFVTLAGFHQLNYGMFELARGYKDRGMAASGEFQQAEFAADLAKVHSGSAPPEYRDPRQFFSRTYLTEGLSALLVGAAKRLSGNGGDPVVQLQTNFGGGKTHSMLALYHLFSGADPGELAGVDAVLAEAAAIGRSLGDHRLQAYAGWVAMRAASMRGDAAATARLAREVERHPGDWFDHPTGAEFLAEAAEAMAFSAEERELLAGLRQDAAAEWPLRLWCAKEAAAKALGRGLAGGPQALTVANVEAAAGLARVVAHGKAQTAFTLRDGDLIAAVVVSADQQENDRA